MPVEIEQCVAAVYKRDTYRMSHGMNDSGTRRTKRHFVMHYTREQCSRKPKENGRCWQHQRESYFPSIKW
jgi:hypothetical protein